MTYESTCPRCGAMLTSGGCLSCGYPNGGLRERTAADTTLAEKSKGDAPLGYVRYELLAEAWDSISKLGRELFDARTCIEELEAEIVNHESWLTTQQAATYAAEAERDEARRELAEAEEALRYVVHGDGYDAYRSEPTNVLGYTGTGGVWFPFPGNLQPAVRRAINRAVPPHATDEAERSAYAATPGGVE